MAESKGIASLFEKLYDGKPWIDVNIVSVLQPISAEHAAKRVFPKNNTIWEILNHMIAWRTNVLQRVQGKVLQSPDHNYFEKITDTTEAAWMETLERLEQTQQAWLQFLKDTNSDTFGKNYAPNNMTYYEHIQGLLQHDAYHLGQIAMMAKYP
tara:strand:+ start:2082 stop:2540 length:459 start_codon:yes stop_codon:yes gene_type:complete